ncbi:MAG: hypothetical protein HRU69_14105 [Flammeovirgaceae bacterium]|nr:MAG: hypothetical protein HRU69_14105 [Flammeovirgaceae bacterium]
MAHTFITLGLQTHGRQTEYTLKHQSNRLDDLDYFGTVTLWVVFQIIGTIIFDNSIDNFTAGQEEYNDVATNMRDAAIQMRVILFIAGGLTLLTSIGSLGLLRLKNWGLILYQSSTIAVILVFIGGLGYYVYDVQTKMDERYDRALEFECQLTS